ncbi:MAG: hypothetical protein KAQ85_03100 [Thermodesulfovibrionia bacterium]|nr:hypothetical protein [Thermodesulfovibrionia bacterium]
MAVKNPKIRKVTDKNFYQLGELLIVNIRKFGGSAQISDEQAEERFKEDRDVLRGVQDLLLPADKDALSALDTIKSEVLGYIARNSVPHDLPCFYFIYKEDKGEINTYLTRKLEETKELVEFFVDRWPEIEKAYAKAKPKLYRADKYPSKAMLRSRFRFDWKWKEIMPADSGSDDLKQEIQTMKNYVLASMKKTIAERMDVLAKSCTNGNVSQATLDSIDNQIFDKYDRLFAGFIDSADFASAIADIKDYLEGTDAEMLRSDEDFKTMVAAKAKEVAKTISKVKEPKDDRALLI